MKFSMNKMIIRILNRLRILKNININSSTTINKRRFIIPVIGKVGLANVFMSEPWMIDVMKIVLPIESGKFIDVGVNIGQTLLKLRCVSNEYDYIGFEPNPQCVSYVNKLIKKKNTLVFNFCF